MSRPYLFELKDVTYTYPGRSQAVLEGFNFAFSEDQRIGLIGPNGCGKTTLFHVVMGLLKPHSGELLFRDKIIRSKADFRDLRKDIGLLFQDADDQLFSPTVLEDVAFGPLNLGMSPEQAKETALTTLEDLGLLSFADRITHKLSGGEKKLVSLATILAMKPKGLLLDEPTNNLDPKTREQLIQILADLPIAYIIISHDWDFLSDTCQDLYAMDKGTASQCEKAHIHNHAHAHVHGKQPHKHGH